MTISSRPEIKDLLPYSTGKPIEEVKREFNLENVIKLASNENPLGSSPKANQAIKDNLNNFCIYPDDKCALLKEKLSEKFNVNPKNILTTNGSSQMIDLISEAYINKGDESIMGDITFQSYKKTIVKMGGVPIEIPLKNFTLDLDEMFKAINEKTKIIWICNPNNPTGTIVGNKEFIKFLNKVPEDILVISDEAYREYVTQDDYPWNTHELIGKYPNLIVLRTFSKIYGLAALRVGYSFADEKILKEINKIRTPFNVNTLSQWAAIGALEDEEYVKKSYSVNAEGKEYLYSEFEKLGFKYIPTESNHIFVDIKTDGYEVFNKLQAKGVIIRPQFDNFIRISIGTMEENKIFIEKLKEVI